MAEVGGKPFQPIGNEFQEGSFIFIFFGKNADVRIHTGGSHIQRQSGFRMEKILRQKLTERFLGFFRIFNPSGNEIIIKVGIGNGDKEIIFQHMGHIRRYSMPFPAACCGQFSQSFGYINEYILQMGCGRFLSAHSSCGAAFSTGSFLTLIAKHLILHIFPPLLNRFFMPYYYR